MVDPDVLKIFPVYSSHLTYSSIATIVIFVWKIRSGSGDFIINVLSYGWPFSFF